MMCGFWRGLRSVGIGKIVSIYMRHCIWLVESITDSCYLGISSPRVTQMKLGKSPIFGSMDDHEFTVSPCQFLQTIVFKCLITCETMIFRNDVPATISWWSHSTMSSHCLTGTDTSIEAFAGIRSNLQQGESETQMKRR
jgi:hypothetical protein